MALIKDDGLTPEDINEFYEMKEEIDWFLASRLRKQNNGFERGLAGGLPLESGTDYWRGYGIGRKALACERKNSGLCPCCGSLHI